MSSANERAIIEVSAAAEKLEHRRRGWTTEEDKKIKIFNLPKVKKRTSTVLNPLNGSMTMALTG